MTRSLLAAALFLPGSLLLTTPLVAQRVVSTPPLINPGPPAIVAPAVQFGVVDENGNPSAPWVMLEWADVPLVSRWRVYRADASRGPFVELRNVGDRARMCTTGCAIRDHYPANTSFVGQTVYYRVEGTSDGMARPTAASAATPVALPGWFTPMAGLTANRTTLPNGLNVGWTPDPNVTGYDVTVAMGTSGCYASFGVTIAAAHFPSQFRDLSEGQLCTLQVTSGSTWTITVLGKYPGAMPHVRRGTLTVTIP